VIGSSARPMSDRDLELKVEGLCEGVLPLERTRALIAACWALPALPDVAALARAAVPADDRGVGDKPAKRTTVPSPLGRGVRGEG
jgi:hypothetical protein